MIEILRFIGMIAPVLIFLILASTSFAGTPYQRALAAVATARAAIEIADERPKLPDTGRPNITARSNEMPLNAFTDTKLLQINSNDTLPHDAALPGKDAHKISAEPFAIRSIRIQLTTVPLISDILPAQIVVGSWERGCPACTRLEHEIKAVLTPLKWTIGDGAENQIRLTHVAMTEPAPQIRLYQNGVVIKNWQGYQDPAMLSQELRAAWDNAVNHLCVGAGAGPAGTIFAGSQIRQLLTWWRGHIGQGRQAKFHWDRTGAESFPLLAKGDWSVKALFGEAGRIELSAPGVISLPIDSLRFAYRITGPDVVIDADPIVIPGLATRLGTAGPQELASSTPVQFIDPLTAWSIFSMLREIWSLLHPTCDVEIGGTVSACAILSDDKFTVEFTDGPSIKLVALFTFQLKVQRVEITESNVRLVFSGSRLVKERTFQVR